MAKELPAWIQKYRIVWLALNADCHICGAKNPGIVTEEGKWANSKKVIGGWKALTSKQAGAIRMVCPSDKCQETAVSEHFWKYGEEVLKTTLEEKDV